MHSIFLFGTPPKFVKSPSYPPHLNHTLLLSIFLFIVDSTITEQ